MLVATSASWQGMSWLWKALSKKNCEKPAATIFTAQSRILGAFVISTGKRENFILNAALIDKIYSWVASMAL